MDLVERIWSPTTKDLLSGLRQTRYFEVQSPAGSAAASQIVNALVACPPDTVRFITAVSILATPGAAQFFDSWSWGVLTPGVPTTLFNFTSTPRQRIVATSSGDVVLPGIAMLPGETWQFGARFNAGANVNSVSVSAFGWDIPRANIV